MSVYFLAAEGIPAIKVGYTGSGDAISRLSMNQVGSPVRLRLAAVDRRGDVLTEAELLQRFRSDRLHGEWFLATEQVRAVVAAVAEGRGVPNGMYFPNGYAVGPWNHADRGASMGTLKERFNLSRQDIINAIGYQLVLKDALGVHPAAIVRLYYFLRAQGRTVTVRDFLPEPWNTRPAEVPA